MKQHASLLAIVLMASLVVLLMCHYDWMATTATTSGRHRHYTRSLQNLPIVRSDKLMGVLQTQGEKISQLLNESAHTYFCPASQEILHQHYPPLDYEACSDTSIFHSFPFNGGMTNGLKFLLLGALLSVETGRCFTGGTPTARKYFEDTGLRLNHTRYTNALRGMNNSKLVRIMWQTTWGDTRLRRIESQTFDFTNTTTFGYNYPSNPQVNGVSLKRDFMRRFWKLRPAYRESTCQALQNETQHDLFGKDYIAFSVRRGDKTTEGFKFPTMMEYIIAAQPVMEQYPQMKIFVATDDCKVLPELRALRPEWKFESQCDYMVADTNNNGFVLSKLNHLSSDQRDLHFRKFFVELYAMAMSKVFIGVSYTNVAWFVYMLRPDGVDKATFQLIDVKTGWDPLDQW